MGKHHEKLQAKQEGKHKRRREVKTDETLELKPAETLDSKPEKARKPKLEKMRERKRDVHSNSRQSQNEKPWDTLFAEALLLHHQATAGDKQAAKQAFNMLQRVHVLVPDNNLVKAYFGSSMTLLGRDANQKNTQRLKFGNQGLSLLDDAVSAVPENVEIRTLRAFVCNALPEKYFHRTQTAIEDFEYVVSRYRDNSTVTVKELYWKVLYELGKAYKREGRNNDAETTWQKLLSETTDPKYNQFLVQEGMHLTSMRLSGAD